MSRAKTKKSLQELFTGVGLDVGSPKLDAALDLLAVQLQINHAEIRNIIDEYNAIVFEKANELQTSRTTIEIMRTALTDTRTELLAAQQQIELQAKELLKKELRCDQYEVEIRRLKEKNKQAYKLLGQMHHEITTRKKKMRIAQYNAMLDDMAKRINGIMPRQARKQQRDREVLDETMQAFANITTKTVAGAEKTPHRERKR